MSTIKYNLLHNWHAMRIIRLVLGIWLMAMALQSHDYMPGAVSAFLLIQAITNTGCCGSTGSCGTPKRYQQYDKDEIPEAGYEEIQ